MKQLVTLILVMTCSFYYSQSAANNDLHAKNPYDNEGLVASFHKSKSSTALADENKLSDSGDAISEAPQSNICPKLSNKNIRLVIPGTSCKQYAYCVYKRDGSRQLFSSYIYTCPTISKFNPVTQKCTANVFTCPS